MVSLQNGELLVALSFSLHALDCVSNPTGYLSPHEVPTTLLFTACLQISSKRVRSGQIGQLKY